MAPNLLIPMDAKVLYFTLSICHSFLSEENQYLQVMELPVYQSTFLLTPTYCHFTLKYILLTSPRRSTSTMKQMCLLFYKLKPFLLCVFFKVQKFLESTARTFRRGFWKCAWNCTYCAPLMCLSRFCTKISHRKWLGRFGYLHKLQLYSFKSSKLSSHSRVNVAITLQYNSES